jgi:hypothetical protein
VIILVALAMQLVAGATPPDRIVGGLALLGLIAMGFSARSTYKKYFKNK